MANDAELTTPLTERIDKILAPLIADLREAYAEAGEERARAAHPAGIGHTVTEYHEEPAGEQPREHPVNCRGLHSVLRPVKTWAYDAYCDDCREKAQR